MILTILAVLAVACVLVAAAAIWFDWHLIDEIGLLWRLWSVRLQAFCALLTGWLTIDPGAMLYALNLMPGPVRAALPPSVMQALSIIGAALLVLNVLTIIARGVAQPKARQ